MARVMIYYGDASRCGKLFTDPAGIAGDPFEQFQSCGCGNGQYAVMAFHRPFASVDRGNAHLPCAKQMKRQSAANNIDDGIDSAHLMKMNLADGCAMHFGLSGANHFKNFYAIVFNFSGQARFVD